MVPFVYYTFHTKRHQIRNDQVDTAVPDAEVREEVLILLAAKARDEAVFDAARGDFDAALSRISTLKQELRASGSPRLAEEADALEVAETYLEPATFAEGGRKNLHYDSWNRHRGRNQRRAPES